MEVFGAAKDATSIPVCCVLFHRLSVCLHLELETNKLQVLGIVTLQTL
jgi:hypothetical protein